MKNLEGWVPMRIYWRQSRLTVDWCFPGDLRFTDPFFDQTIGQCLRRPADLLFRHQTPIEALEEWAAARPGLPPKGFIFHMSRCGSTLIIQMLAALSRNVAISEAAPIDSILRAPFHNGAITRDQTVRWLRGIVSALGQQRHPEEEHFFVKFDCWHTLFLPVIQQAFPSVPWVFVYREPVEVLVSQFRQRGGQIIPGIIEPALAGIDPQALPQMPLNEYGARMLARICESALAQVQTGAGKLVNYRQLPHSVWPALMQFFGVEFSTEERERMFAASRFNAKNPVLPFENDTAEKNRAATEEIRQLSQRWLDEVYGRLEARRLIRGFK